MKRSFSIEICSDSELWERIMTVDSYSHTCKIGGGFIRMYFHDTSEHSLYKKLIPIFGIFENVPNIKCYQH